VTTSVRWRHLGATELDRIAFGTDTNGRAPVPRLPARNYFDLDAAIVVTEGLTFNAGVSNVLNEQPPIFGLDVGGVGASANTYPGTFDALGRSYRVAATVRF
jgi:outer membrane receptor protein involved in Fe transport